MTKTLVIIAHPDIDNSGSQQFLMESCQNLEGVVLYILEDKKIDSLEEQEQLKQYDRLVFQFPMYWYSAPFILKKWLDDVFQDTSSIDFLKGKELGLVISMGVSEDSFAAGKEENFTLSELFRPYEAFAKKAQMKYLPIFPISLFSYLLETEKKELLIKYQQYLTKENKNTFKSKESWFINQLEKDNEKSSEEFLSILTIIQNNRDELDELVDLVREMREE